MAGKVVISVSFDERDDRDLLRWLGRQKNKSEAVRTAIRAQLGGGGVTLTDVFQAVKGLERKLEAGAVVVGNGSGGGDVPADVKAALDALGQV